MARVAVANHGTRTLQVAPEPSDNPIGTTHTLTATLSSAADVTSSTIEVDFEISGPGDTDGGNAELAGQGGANDPDNSASAGTPDVNDVRTTKAEGTCTVTIAASESQARPAEICIWIMGCEG